jgi:hypothetical protein
MRTSTTVTRLSILIALLAIVAAGVGLFWQTGGQAVPFQTLRGDTVQIYGDGLYRYDTTLIAVGFKTGDVVTLVLGVPVLIVALWLYRRGSVRGGVVLTGTLAYLLYTYASLALGAAYNNLLLIYIALTAFTLLALIAAFTGFDRDAFPARFSERLPRRGIAVFLMASGVILFSIWLVLSIVPALLAGTTPLEVTSYTTVITFVVDMAVIAPALFIAGRLLLKREPIGYLLAAVMLIFTDLLGISLIAMGVIQQAAGLISVGQFIGFVVSFGILTLFALASTVRLFRAFSNSTVVQPAAHVSARHLQSA